MVDRIDRPGMAAGDRLSTVAVGLVGIAAAVLNIVFVCELAIAAGYPDVLSPLYWLVLDGTGLAAARVLLTNTDHTVRRWAGFTAVFALLISMGACGLHAFIADGQLPRWASFAISAAPALMLGLSCKILMLVLIARPQTPVVAQTVDDGADASETAVATPRSQSADSGGSQSDDQKPGRPARGTKSALFRAALDALEPTDTRPTNELVAALNAGIGLHPGTARRMVGEYRAERDRHVGPRLSAVNG